MCVCEYVHGTEVAAKKPYLFVDITRSACMPSLVRGALAVCTIRRTADYGQTPREDHAQPTLSHRLRLGPVYLIVNILKEFGLHTVVICLS